MKKLTEIEIETIERLLEEHEIDTVVELKKILEDYDNSALFTVIVYKYLQEKNLTSDFKIYSRIYQK